MRFEPRPGETPQDAGRRFESFFAKRLGARPQKGSGSQWTAKLDIDAGSVLFSLKWTSHESFRIDRSILAEAEQAARGLGSSDLIPAVATGLANGDVYVTLRAEDFLRALSDTTVRFSPSQGDQKRLRSRVPALLRDESDD